MSTIKCPKCGNDIYSNAEHCKYCDYKLRNDGNITMAEKFKEEKIEYYMSKIQPPENISHLYEKTINFYRKLKMTTALFFSIVVIICLLYGMFSSEKYLISISVILACLGSFLYWLIPKENIGLKRQMNEYKTYEKNPEQWKRKRAIELYNKEYGHINHTKTIQNKPIITCPYCGSSNVIKVSTASRVVSTAAVGIASKKIGKQWKCNNCKSYF